ncbi:DUF4255 domain-containing protein [Jatrophihabitans sp.]|uniref:DUF4255 domain-containing protein n=1 Tax=Jatrophihabitans sp. TaxID=1932789 RepID=UPI002EF201D8
MAGYQALAAAGLSIIALLNRRLGEVPAASNVTAYLASSEDLKDIQSVFGDPKVHPVVSVFCYRITVDKPTRPGWSAVGHADGIARIPLCMHLLVSAWAGDTGKELSLLGLAAQILESESILAGPVLDPSGDWQPGDTVEIVPDDLALESMTEAFQALTTEYRLTLPYLARVICIEGRYEPPAEPVATVAAGTG